MLVYRLPARVKTALVRIFVYPAGMNIRAPDVDIFLQEVQTLSCILLSDHTEGIRFISDLINVDYKFNYLWQTRKGSICLPALVCECFFLLSCNVIRPILP